MRPAISRPKKKGTKKISFYHPHFGKVEKAVLGEIGCAFFDKGQIRQVHAQVRNARRIATMKRVAQIAESAVCRHDALQLVDRLPRLLKTN